MRPTVETLRASIAFGQIEAERLSALIQRSQLPAATNWAKLDLERLNKRIQAHKNELAKLESK
jgi:hypothetical protein